jgi:hypothetical protein
MHFFSRTRVEKLQFTQKLPNIAQIQVCADHSHRGSGEATMGKHFYVFIMKKKSLKIFSIISWPISIKLDTNHS